MGILKKIVEGDAKYYKVYRRCSTCSDTNVYLVRTKSGRDLQAEAKKDAKALLDAVYGSSCAKCSLSVDEVADEDVKKAKKYFTLKEVD